MARPTVAVFSNQPLFDSFFQGAALRRLSRMFSAELVEQVKLNSTAIDVLARADALITTWDSPHFGGDLSELAPRLRIIAHCGGEVKNRFDHSLFSRLTITNSAGPFARPSAEFAATLLLYTARNIDAYRAAMRKQPAGIYAALHCTGRLPGFPGVEGLAGREVSMIGLGRIGRALMDLLKGFEIRWLVHDPYATADAGGAHDVRFLPLAAVLKRAPHLVVAAAVTEKTCGMLNAKRLALLPDGATIINVARGSLIDLPALTREVQSGRLRCALDVTDPEEPLPANHPLRRLPGAILTPHVAAGGIETRKEIANVVLTDLERFFHGEPVLNRVTAEMLERMT